MSSDTCKACKTVSGDGPLTGDYVLVDSQVDTQEFNCVDGCVYNRVGEDQETKYCFRIDYTPYTVEACEQVGRYSKITLERAILKEAIFSLMISFGLF